MKRLLLALGLFLLSISVVHAQSSPIKYFSAASTNAQNLWSGRAVLHALLPVNTTATVYYLKLYDKATTPVCGTDIPKWTIPIPASTVGAGVALPSTDGLLFGTGLGICITGALADNDTTPAAVGVAVNFGVGSN